MNLSRSLKLAFLIAPLLLTAGCVSVVEDAVISSIQSIAPKATLLADGSYEVPEFSTPETGQKFSTTSPQSTYSSFRAMTDDLPKNEKIHLTRVIISLANYHGCLEHGYKSYQYERAPFNSGKKNPSQCKIDRYYSDTYGSAESLLKEGRPDTNRLRTSQLTYGGAPIGKSEVVGTTDAQSWQQWIDYSGYNLNGKTRTGLMKEFLHGTGGLYAWQKF